MTAASPNLVSLLQQRVQERPDQLAYVFLSGEELRQSHRTYRELDSQARTVAGLLRSMKARGQRALLLYPPGLDFIAAFFGCLYAGVIGVPAYPPRLNRNALRILAIAQDSGAALAMTTQDVYSRLPAIAGHAPELAKLQWIATDTLDSQAAESDRVALPPQNGLAYLQYTSGSTADPKGVMITHENVLQNSDYIAKAFGHSGEDISLSWLPHFHDLGLVHGILQPLYSAFPGYLMAPMSFLQRPLDWLKAISRFHVTHSDGPNFAYELCVSKIAEEDKRGLDLSTWRMALNGAEPIFGETIERFASAFASCGFKKAAFYPAYGLAEATLVVSGGKNRPEPATCSVVSSSLEQNKVVIANELGSDQRALVGSGTFASPMEVEIVDPNSGRKCASDEIGEIWVSGPSVALGYWNRHEETEQVFKAKLRERSERVFLRTGDLGFVHCGNLFIAGRLKELIIVRGRNYYPQDVERTAQEACPELRLATGAAFSTPVGTEEQVVLVQELQRHQKFDSGEVFRHIREAVAEEHELQLLEIVLVEPGSVPKTSSGKIQRRLCRKEFLEGKLQVITRWQARAAENELQQEQRAGEIADIDDVQTWLRSRVASRLGLNARDIDVNRPLLHFGLDSLGAVELAHDVQKKFGVVWPASSFLEEITIRDLADRAAQGIENKERGGTRPPRAGGEEEYPLSFGQQGLWFLHRLSPESVAYNIIQAVRITSAIDLSALRRSFQTLVSRHASLRTTFAVADGTPVQRIRQDAELCFNSEDARNWSEAQLNERLNREAHKPFDLERGPLFRAQVLSRSTCEHVLLLSAHHIILDLWSLAQFVAELGVLYAAEQSGEEAELPAAPFGYSQFVYWQKEMLAGERGRQLWSYWSRQLAGELPVLELPTDRVRPAVQTYLGSSWPFKLNAELTLKLEQLGRQCGATLYMTLLAAFQVLLHRYTGERDVVVGSPTAGRTRDEFASTVGYFVNPVVLRGKVSPDCNFQSFLRDHIRKVVLQALEHQEYPFTVLTERLQPVRDPQRSPIFQVMFAMQKAPQLHEQGLSLFALGESAARTNLGGLEMQSVALEQRIAQFDLSLIAAETPDGLAATFEYNIDLFDSATIGRMARHFQTLLQDIVNNPAREISRLSLLTDVEAKEIIHSAQPKSSGPLQQPPVHRLFEEQAARTPDAVAIMFEGQEISYRELNERANRFAHYLVRSGVQTGTPVAICFERSAEMIVTLLGVLKSGGVYVPLDPEYPKERLDFLLDDCGAKVLITREHLLHLHLEAKHRVVRLDAAEESVARESAENPAIRIDESDLSYIIYTSGSTGAPKGVLVSHGAMGNQIQWLAAEFPLHEPDRVLHKYSLSFDASLAEIFHPLITGAALVIARPGGHHDPRYLTQLIREQGVTQIDFVPTMLKALLEQEGILGCKSLRRIISGGETLFSEVKNRVYERLGPVELINMYGPTESAITATFHRCSPEENRPRVPIGLPVANTQIHVLDDGFQPLPLGVLGEIYIGGKSQACGYLNQGALTAKKFVPDPFSAVPGARLYRTGDLGRRREDGAIEYIGRADAQVKIRGFRIELAEIECALKKENSVRDVAAVLKTRNDRERYIAAYVETAPGESITSAQLRARLSEILPQHMIPAAIIVLERLPRLPGGKVDVRALPEPANAVRETEPEPPRNNTEAALVRIWEQVLGRKCIGINDNFFELGGDSILSIQVVARAREIGLELTPTQMFQWQTIADLARIVGTASSAAGLSEMSEGPFPLTPIQQWFFEQDLKAANHYSQSLLLELDRPLDAALLREAMQYLILRHDALRLRFDRGDTGWQQRTSDADSAAALEYISLRHLSPDEQLEQVDAVAATIRMNLDLAQGPIVRAAYFDLGPENPHRLFMAVHHLAVDAVSWRILLDDLQRIYDQLKACKEPSFPGTPLSFQQWAELLQRYATSKELLEESAWWAVELAPPANRLPVDHDGNNTSESAATVLTSLSYDETRRLLQELPRAYSTGINDVLLAALAQTLARWAQQEFVLIDLEGHGRGEIIEGVDPSGTVGWFTSMYPVLLQVKTGSNADERLKSVKEHLRNIPNKGIGFGLLRYLCADKPLERRPGPQVSFNYLGQLDRISASGSPFRVIRLEGPMRTSFGIRSHVLEIDAYIHHGVLYVGWTYTTALYDENTIRALAATLAEELRGFIQHCPSRETGEHTTCDFPLVQLTERQLGRIRALHGSIADIYPLSPMQLGMLFHSLYEPQKGTYLTQLVCELSGALDRDRLQRAWEAVIANHSALRSEFEWEIVSDEPVQLVTHTAQPKWHFGDWSHAGLQEQSKLLDDYLREDREQPMDVQRGPLMRFALFAADPSKHVFIWSSHHLLMDGWSLPLVLKEVFASYEALSRKERVDLKPERPYRDYIAWLKQQDFTAAKKFWRNRLEGFSVPTTLKALHRPARHGFDGKDFCEYEVHLSDAETSELSEFARQHRLTLSTVIYGMWAVLLSRITGTSDVLFGVVVSGRRVPLARAGEIVGVFINSLPLRAKVEPEALLPEWLTEIQDRQSEAARFEHSSLSSTQSWSELPRGTALFDHILVLENYPAESWSSLSNELRILNMRSCERSNYPLTIWVMPGRQLCVKVAYDPCFLDNGKVTSIVENYRALLSAARAFRDRRILELIRHCVPFSAPATVSVVANTETETPSQSTLLHLAKPAAPLAGINQMKYSHAAHGSQDEEEHNL